MKCLKCANVIYHHSAKFCTGCMTIMRTEADDTGYSIATIRRRYIRKYMSKEKKTEINQTMMAYYFKHKKKIDDYNREYKINLVRISHKTKSKGDGLKKLFTT